MALAALRGPRSRIRSARRATTRTWAPSSRTARRWRRSSRTSARRFCTSCRGASASDESKVFELQDEGRLLPLPRGVLDGGDRAKVSGLADEAYAEATKIARDETLEGRWRLAKSFSRIALNYSVFHFEIQNTPQEACAAKQARRRLRRARHAQRGELQGLHTHTQLLRDNLTPADVRHQRRRRGRRGRQLIGRASERGGGCDRRGRGARRVSVLGRVEEMTTRARERAPPTSST